MGPVRCDDAHDAAAGIGKPGERHALRADGHRLQTRQATDEPLRNGLAFRELPGMQAGGLKHDRRDDQKERERFHWRFCLPLPV